MNPENQNISEATSFPRTKRHGHFLVAPTASGKSAVAQRIAELRGWCVLSADSMLVYHGMDVGTDKPGVDDRGGVPYYGLDLAEPVESFSVGRYLESVRSALPEDAGVATPLLVAGGTGLYISGLVRGLDTVPAVDPARHAAWDARLTEKGLAVLQEDLRRRSPARYEGLKDPCNPRRVIRALELCEAGLTDAPAVWVSPAESVPLVGLRRAPDELNRRIEARVKAMFAGGLVQEVRGLLGRYGELSGTAGKAIGYAEAIALLSGACSEADAIEQTIRRTRRLAKRQRTWFAHREHVSWVDVDGGMDVDTIAQHVEAEWGKHGPTAMSF